ncbi:MAG: hypothetical protein WC222_05345 [Parachlamydiales bacterium]|jgi:hypothetical protein
MVDRSFTGDILYTTILLLLLFASLCLTFFFGWWVQKQRDSVCPYTGSPLRRAESLTFYSKEQILRFLYEYNSYDNPMFKLKSSSFCRDTGRIFSNSLTWYDTVRVDWTFLQKRHPGRYVSWGSLTKDQQDYIKKTHPPLRGFQTTYSSSNSSPRDVQPEFALAKPGPLYVDVDNNVLLGWKIVPGTEFEVLIVQKPTKVVMVNVEDSKT